MNNPIRALIQEHYEMKILRKMSSSEKFYCVLEIGCGNGNGTRLIKKYFAPEKIFAIDLDERMINIAKKRNANNNIAFSVMDAARLEFPDNKFDAIFDFGIIHHIPNWRICISELHRVLKPGGELLLEELSIDSFTKDIGNLWRKILDHPYNEMFTSEEFVEYLSMTGFGIQHYQQFNPLKLLRHFSLKAIKK
jgi:ubiquinone/menaquinone biosynthesis C-methylase UbiE